MSAYSRQLVNMHPYTVAKLITSIAYLHGRKIYLNMVAGGFTMDLVALNDTTPHDFRYDRLVEYTNIITSLVAGRSPVNFEGRFYKVSNLGVETRRTGRIDARHLYLRILGGWAPVSVGNRSDRDRVSAPAARMRGASRGPARGIRVGIIARQSSEEAWRIAHARFPEDRRGQLAHELAMEVSDSSLQIGNFRIWAKRGESAAARIGWFRSRTTRPSVHIWLAATGRYPRSWRAI